MTHPRASLLGGSTSICDATDANGAPVGGYGQGGVVTVSGLLGADVSPVAARARTTRMCVVDALTGMVAVVAVPVAARVPLRNTS